MYLLGLRAAAPPLRAQFFQLYHRHIPPTLYDRLAFIIVGQDWDAMSGGFWLKQALDLLLSVLKVGGRQGKKGRGGGGGLVVGVARLPGHRSCTSSRKPGSLGYPLCNLPLQDEERIMLAPNSAQIPPLITGTKQNVFNPQQQQQAQQQAQAAQQQHQQQQQAAAAATAAAAAEQPVKAEGEAAAATAASGAVKMEVDAAPKSEDGAQRCWPRCCCCHCALPPRRRPSIQPAAVLAGRRPLRLLRFGAEGAAGGGCVCQTSASLPLTAGLGLLLLPQQARRSSRSRSRAVQHCRSRSLSHLLGQRRQGRQRLQQRRQQ
jgi:transformation/transcription domain-associated protein